MTVVERGIYRIEVTRELCKACGLCVAWCPQKVLASDDEEYPVVVNAAACVDCKSCERHCPELAIEVIPAIQAIGQQAGSSMPQIRFMHGNEAAAEGAIAAGCRFYAGYPITPSTEIAEILSQRLPEIGGIFVQMEDEIASMAAVIGASLGGLKSATATSGPGFSLMQENLGFAVACEIPCVIMNVQRVGPSTGMATKPAQGDVMQARWGTHGDHPIIVLTPSSVQESYRLAVRAFELSERFRTPVILLMDGIVAQLKERVELPDAPTVVVRSLPTEPPETYRPFAYVPGGVQPLAPFGSGYRYHVTGMSHDEFGFPTEKPEHVAEWRRHMASKIDDHLDDILEWEEYGVADADVVVISFGATARSVAFAVEQARARGIKAGALKILTIWPFPEAHVRAIAARVPRIVVAEMNLGQIRLEVERVVAGRAVVQGVHRADGLAITPEQILAAIIDGGSDPSPHLRESPHSQAATASRDRLGAS